MEKSDVLLPGLSGPNFQEDQRHNQLMKFHFSSNTINFSFCRSSAGEFLNMSKEVSQMQSQY